LEQKSLIILIFKVWTVKAKTILLHTLKWFGTTHSLTKRQC